MKGKYIRTPEIKAKMREAKLGEKNPNYGKRGIESSQFGKPAWNKGLTKETDERVMRNVLNTQQTLLSGVAHLSSIKGWVTRRKNNIVGWNKGKHGLQVAWNRGLTKKTDPRIAHYSENLIGHSTSRETRDKISSKQKELWKNEEHIRKVVKAVLRANHARPNKPELNLTNLLDTWFPNEWKYVGNGEVVIERKNPDFININGKKKIIELFGNYWHSEKVVGRTTEKEEKKRIEIFAKYEYDTLIIWQNELQDEFSLVQKIERWSNGQ